MAKEHPIVIEDGDKAPGQYELLRQQEGQPPAEDDLGGGDICSIEETPSTEDDQPLD